jgi:hypothetical protein
MAVRYLDRAFAFSQGCATLRSLSLYHTDPAKTVLSSILQGVRKFVHPLSFAQIGSQEAAELCARDMPHPSDLVVAPTSRREYDVFTKRKESEKPNVRPKKEADIICDRKRIRKEWCSDCQCFEPLISDILVSLNHTSTSYPSKAQDSATP